MTNTLLLNNTLILNNNSSLLNNTLLLNILLSSIMFTESINKIDHRGLQQQEVFPKKGIEGYSIND